MWTSINIVLLAIVCLVQALHLRRLSKIVRENERMMIKIGMIVMKEDMVETMKNLHESLENLFNPKDKTDVKNTRTKRATK